MARDDHGDAGVRLKRDPAALSNPFLRVFITAKLGLACGCRSLHFCSDAEAVRSESMLLSGFEGFFGLPELETRII